MRALGIGNSAQIERRVSSSWVRVQVEDHLGVMQTHSPYEVEYEQPSVDTPIGQATVRIRRGQGASSYAPLMTANPPIDIGRRFTIEIDAGSETWTPVFSGRIDFVSWPERYGDLEFRGRDLLGMAADQQITVEREYGSEAGEPLEDVMQEVTDDTWDASYGAAPTLDSETTGAVVLDDPPYVPSQVSIYDALQSLAESIGAVVHQRWTGAAWQPSLVEPERDKTVPDHTFAPSLYYEVTAMEQDVEDIRNVVEVEYSTTGEARETEEATDAGSVTKYGRRYMRIIEASDSPIRTASAALELAQAAVSDLAEPDATMEIVCAYFWPGEVGVDLYRFTANDIHFSADQDLAPVAISHRLTINQRAETVLRVRGKPSAGVLLWRRKSRGATVPVPADALKILDVALTEQTATLDTWTVLFGAAVEEAHVYVRAFDSADPPADWKALLYTEENLLTPLYASGDTFSTARPAEGTCVAIGVLPMGLSASGDMPVAGDGWELLVQGGTAAISAAAEFTRLTSTTERMDLTVTDPRGVVSGVNVYETLKGATTGPFAATLTGGEYQRTYTLDPDHTKYLRVEVTRSDGNPPLVLHFEADIDEIPGIPAVREVRIVDQASLYVDAVDTDTASLHYVEVVGGVPGAEVDILPRGSDPRFGAFTVTAGSDSRVFRVYGRNAAGDAGEYREVVVTRYIPVESAGVMREQITEDDSTGTLTLVPVAGAAFDEVEFATRTGSGAWTAFVEDASAPYEATITKDAKHTSAIAYRVSLGGVVIQERIVSGFDIGTIANVVDALPTYDRDAGTADVRVLFDTDTAIGTGEAGYRLDGGSETLIDVDADREALITVTLSTSAEILMEVRGYNGAGSPGPWFALTLERHKVQPASFARIASLSAERTQAGLCGSSTYLQNTVTAEFEGAEAGDTWDLRRFIDGVEDAAVVVNEDVTTTVVVDEITGYQLGLSGSGELFVSYRAELTPAAGGWDTRDSPAIIQEHQACP